jgi:hypothetical protein
VPSEFLKKTKKSSGLDKRDKLTSTYSAFTLFSKQTAHRSEKGSDNKKENGGTRDAVLDSWIG